MLPMSVYDRPRGGYCGGFMLGECVRLGSFLMSDFTGFAFFILVSFIYSLDVVDNDL
jgi:hypothetical protein